MKVPPSPQHYLSLQLNELFIAYNFAQYYFLSNTFCSKSLRELRLLISTHSQAALALRMQRLRVCTLQISTAGVDSRSSLGYRVDSHGQYKQLTSSSHQPQQFELVTDSESEVISFFGSISASGLFNAGGINHWYRLKGE
jgi:hypothetical protein